MTKENTVDSVAFLKTRVRRRKFIQMMMGASAGLLLSGFEVTSANSATPTTDSSEVTALPNLELASPLSEIDADFTFGVPTKSKIYATEAQAASVEKTLDEPVAHIVSETSGIETNAQGAEIKYTDYVLEYGGQQFTARARTIPSDYHSNLHWYFNTGFDSNTYKQRELVAITYGFDTPQSQELSQVTLYILKSYDPTEPNVTDIALNPEFYEPATGNASQQSLKEGWTVAQFAAACNPKSIEAISKSSGIASFNHLRQVDGGKEVHNASVILAAKFNLGGIAVPLDPADDLHSDLGSIYNPSARNPTEAAMWYMAATLSHELGGHGTATLYHNNEVFSHLYMTSPDGLHESQAEMCTAAYWEEMGEVATAEQLYKDALQNIYQLDYESGMYRFQPYEPLLFASLLVPDAAVIASAVGQEISATEESAPFAVTQLNQLHQHYINLRNNVMAQLNSSWLYYWREQFVGDDPVKEMTASYVDVFFPIVFARYQQENRDPLTDKDDFMAAVVTTVEEEVLSNRMALFTTSFSEKGTATLPYFYDGYISKCETIASIDDAFQKEILIQQPAMGETVMVTRKPEPLYTSAILNNLYRKYVPYYWLGKISAAPFETEYVLEKNTTDTDFMVVIKEPVFKDGTNAVASFTSRTLLNGEPLVIKSGQMAVVSILDLRKDQITDDVNRLETPIFSLKAKQAAPITQPPAEPTINVHLPAINK